MSRSLDFYRTVAREPGFAVRDLGTLAGLGHVSGDAAQDAQRMLAFRAAAGAHDA